MEMSCVSDEMLFCQTKVWWEETETRRPQEIGLVGYGSGAAAKTVRALWVERLVSRSLLHSSRKATAATPCNGSRKAWGDIGDVRPEAVLDRLIDR